MLVKGYMLKTSVQVNCMLSVKVLVSFTLNKRSARRFNMELHEDLTAREWETCSNSSLKKATKINVIADELFISQDGQDPRVQHPQPSRGSHQAAVYAFQHHLVGQEDSLDESWRFTLWELEAKIRKKAQAPWKPICASSIPFLGIAGPERNALKNHFPSVKKQRLLIGFW